MARVPEYNFEVPDIAEVRSGLSFVLEYWRPRNQYIEKVREMIAGKNTIKAPVNTPYTIQTYHTYMLTAAINEKHSRFLHLPTVQVVPPPSADLHQDRTESDELEIAFSACMYEMERNGSGDVWGRVLRDAIALDEGVELIERAPAAFWPSLVMKDAKGNPMYPMESDAETAYKVSKGVPIRSLYVPLEDYFPIYEGPTVVEAYHIEQRSVRSVLKNPLFNTAQLQMSHASADELKTSMAIVRYCNQEIYAYYAVQNSGTDPTTKLTLENLGAANPILLYAYPHGLGRVMYNSVSGRFGGWRTNNNEIESVGKAAVDLNAKADDIMSQVLTNIRARYWPTMLHKVDADRRGFAADNNPKAPVVVEGQSVVIYTTEDVEPMFKSEPDETVPYFMGELKGQMSALLGTEVLYGGREPGVDTGYHQNLQITQAEHLDEKMEQHLSWGAISRAEIIARHIVVMDMGKVPIRTPIRDEQTGKKSTTIVYLDPRMLNPLPIMDAQVRKPRPVDLAAASRIARDITDERAGKGPLVSDDYAREHILSISQPGIEKRRILVEKMQMNVQMSGVLQQKLLEKINLIQLSSGIPSVNPGEAAGNVDPALADAVGMLKTPQSAPSNSSDVPLTTGQPAGMAQPEANSGLEIARAVAGGAR